MSAVIQTNGESLTTPISIFTQLKPFLKEHKENNSYYKTEMSQKKMSTR